MVDPEPVNLNTVRAVNDDLGAPVDRFVIMAKCAIRGCNESIADASIIGRLRTYWQTLLFDVRIRYLSFRAWFVERYIVLLQYLGRAPEGMTAALTSKLRTLHDMDDAKANRHISQRISLLNLEHTQRWKDRADTVNEWFFYIMGGDNTLPLIEHLE
ncbi:hypothetical protein QZH41_017194 [Actinostola sp. cb2023]|nr:hypothetical protein QZH41_017194 [Actinostola sp. cb2023]